MLTTPLCDIVYAVIELAPVSEMTHTVSSGTLNSSIPYTIPIELAPCRWIADSVLVHIDKVR